MINTNYSRNASLLDYEIYDFDTTDNYSTGINDGRMRLPTRYDISKFYKRSKNNKEKGMWTKKPESKQLDFSSDFEWQITYSFPNTLRNNITSSGKKYGGDNVTFRRLYLILCERFNGGRYFIDDYFDSVYPYTIKPDLDKRLNIIKQELLDYASDVFDTINEENIEEGLNEIKVTKEGNLSKRASVINKKAYDALNEYESFASAWEENEGIYLANLIKEDIIECMKSGQLQTEVGIPVDSESTKKSRFYAGLNEEPAFSATHRLIESIQLFVNIGGNKQWQTRQGILV